MLLIKLYFLINFILLIREIYLDWKYSPSEEEEEVDNIIGVQNRKLLMYTLILLFGMFSNSTRKEEE